MYLTKDHLGSTRLVTGATGCSGNVGHDYFAVRAGDSFQFRMSGVSCYGQTDTTVKFTEQERDNESGLDNFQARMMSPPRREGF